MTSAIAAAAIALVFATSFISGIFGMAGGFILMGGLLLVLPVATTMVVHGIVQFVSNFSRVVILRRHIAWPVIGWTTAGTVAAVLVFALLRLRPDQRTIFVLLGLMPVFVWLPQHWLNLDAQKPLHGFLAGIASGGFNVGAGVGGPAVDIFFVRTALGRHTIVATKSLIQSIAHVFKVIYWGAAGASLDGSLVLLLVAAIPVTILGANLGSMVLERLSDARFKAIARWIVTCLGAAFLWRAVTM